MTPTNNEQEWKTLVCKTDVATKEEKPIQILRDCDGNEIIALQIPEGSPLKIRIRDENDIT